MEIEEIKKQYELEKEQNLTPITARTEALVLLCGTEQIKI